MQQIGLESGIDVVLRPEDLASDDARVDDAARHALEQLNGAEHEHIVILYANVPVRPAGLIDATIDLLRRTGADSAQSYADVGKHHPWWTARIESADGVVRPWEGDVINHGAHRRQDLPPAYVPDGGVLVVTREALMSTQGDPSPHAFLGSDQRGMVTRSGDVIDIDGAIDVIVADAILTERMQAMGQ